MPRYLQAMLAMSAAGTAAFLLALAGTRFCRPRGGYALRLAALGLFLLPVGLFLAPRAAAPAPNSASIPAGSAPGFAAPPPLPGAFSPGALGGAAGASAPPFWEKPELWAALWLGGTALFLLLALLRRARLTRSRARLPLQKAPPAVERALREAAAGMGLARPPTVSVCPGLATPMLVGLWHSRVLLPEYELSREELLPVLSHELRHSRRGDLWVWLFAELACCLHWWNPAVWILRRQLIRFGELACDEAVAMGLSPEKKRAYSRAILNVLAHARPPGVDETRLPGVAPLSANGRAVKERLELIMNSKKMTKRAGALALTLVLAVSAGGMLVACGLSPARAAQPARPEQPEQTASASASSALASSASASSALASSAQTALAASAVSVPESAPAPTPESWNFPLEGEGIVVSAAYGVRPHHLGHRGVDYAYRDAGGANVSQDQPIYAVKSGTVAFAGWKSSYGNYVEIDHGNGDSSGYAHCSKLLVKQGDAVKQGQNIATLGSTGNATGPCLHFELYLGGELVDPALYLTIPSAGSAPESAPASGGSQ